MTFRQSIAHGMRTLHDKKIHLVLSKTYIADRSDLIAQLEVQHEIQQFIKPSAMFENKLANLTLGAKRINHSLLAPSQTWSFWQYVQRPAHNNGYVKGRNLVNGKLIRQVGGGLCQLSSLMYHLGLLAGLKIIERHPHSVDIYLEHERFTPLGADATVVWGYKDLRMTNPLNTNIVFECVVHEHFLIGRVLSQTNLPKFEVTFDREQINVNQTLVRTGINGKLLTKTIYEQKQGMQLDDYS